MENKVDKELVYKTKNNLWLYLYRIYVSDMYEKPNLCGLTWGGLMGLFTLILAPVYTIWVGIIAIRYKESFQRANYNFGMSGIGKIVCQVLMVIFYMVMVMTSYNDKFDSIFDIPSEYFLYMWLIPFGLIFSFIGFIVFIVFLIDSTTDTVSIAKETVSAKINKMCPQITWVDEDDE